MTAAVEPLLDRAAAAAAAADGEIPPLLTALLAAQAGSADALSSSRIGEAAQLLAALARQLGRPLLAAQSAMGNRLVGAALALHGDLRASDEGSVPVGDAVLLVDAVVSSTGGLLAARDLYLDLGASTVDCVAVAVLGPSAAGVHELLPAEPRLKLAEQ